MEKPADKNGEVTDGEACRDHRTGECGESCTTHGLAV